MCIAKSDTQQYDTLVCEKSQKITICNRCIYRPVSRENSLYVMWLLQQQFFCSGTAGLVTNPPSSNKSKQLPLQKARYIEGSIPRIQGIFYKLQIQLAHVYRYIPVLSDFVMSFTQLQRGMYLNKHDPSLVITKKLTTWVVFIFKYTSKHQKFAICCRHVPKSLILWPLNKYVMNIISCHTTYRYLRNRTFVIM